MTRSGMIYGAGSMMLFVLAGCSREPVPAKPRASPGRVADTADPAPESAPAAAVENSSDGMPIVEDVPVDAGTLQIAADLKQLAAPLTTPEEWESAQTRILEQGANAVPVLAAGLSSEDALEREMAATLLAVIDDGLEPAEQPLRDALHDRSAYVRANAATALSRLPLTENAVIPVLAELLESSDADLRQIAAANLGNYGPEAAPFVDRLAGSLENERPEVLMPVVELLGRIGPAAQAAAPKLRQIAFEQTGEVRAAATAALEQIERENVE